MSEAPIETLEELFMEYFPAWKNRILSIDKSNPDCIQVEIEKKGKCLFGRKTDGSIFFHHDSQILQGS